MAKEHEELGVELYHLWLAGEKSLPAIAAQFDKARRELLGSERMDSCFRRAVEFHSGDAGPVAYSLANLRVVLMSVLRDGSENLLAAGEALKLAAEVYGYTDDRAARKLSDMRNDPGRGEF